MRVGTPLTAIAQASVRNPDCFFCGRVATWRLILWFLVAGATKGYDVGTYGRSVSLLPLARLARRLAGNAKSNQKEAIYRASS